MKASAKIFLLLMIAGLAFGDTTSGTIALDLSDPPSGRVWRHPANKTTDFALVLSGGGARGLSQIGVLEVLEQHGYYPSLVVGVSMGSIIGGLYSAGYSTTQMRQTLEKIQWSELIYDSPKRTKLFQTQRMATEKFLLHLRFRNFRPYIPEGISTAQLISTLLIMHCSAPNYAADGDFDRLKIPFRTVSTDLRTGAPVVFRGGDLAVALRASSAIPLFLSPIEVEGALLADGGLNYPIPVEIALACSADKIVAVDATADLEYPRPLDNALLILDQTTTIMAEEKKRIERRLADVVIKPNLKNRGSYDFDNLDSLIEAGRTATIEALGQIESLLSEPANLRDKKYFLDQTDIGLGENLETIDSLSLDEAADIIRELYSSGIYYDFAADFSISGDSISIELKPVLNSPLRAVKVTGVRPEIAEQLEHIFEIDSTQPANLRTIDSILQMIEADYRSQGFDLAHVSFAAFDGGILGIIFEEGIIEKVEVSGNKRTRESLIKSYSELKVGQKFQSPKLENTIGNLHATNLFDSVIPKLARGDSNVVVRLELTEKPYFGIRLGSRFDITNGVEGAVEVGDDNLFGMSWRINCGLSGGSRRWNTYARTEIDRISKSFITGSAGVFARGTKFDIWDSDTILETHRLNFYSARLSFGQQIRRFGTVFVEVGSEYVEFGRDGSDLKEYPLNRLTLRSLVDTFDDKQFPRNGKFHESFYMISKDILGGEYSFSKAFASFQSYWTFSEPLTLHPYAMGGYASGGLPYFEQFELGQEVPFWGLRGDERRGNSFFKTGFDLRANGMDPVYIFAGVVCGKVWQKDAALHLEELIWGWGAGWGVATPLGPLRLHWGTNTEKLQQISFSFGYNY